MKMRSTLVAMAGLAAAASLANAAVLWDQSALDTSPTGQGLFHTISPGFNGSVVFGVSDVTVPAGGWMIQSFLTYYTSFNFSAGTSAVLNVFPKTGSVPIAVNDPRASPTGNGTSVPVTATDFVVDFQGVREYTASGLNIVLAPGDYWIGLTPVQPSGPFGADFQWSTTAHSGNNQAAWSLDFGFREGWFDYGTLSGLAQHDGAIKIQGIPAPGSLAVLGLGGLLAARRRR